MSTSAQAAHYSMIGRSAAEYAAVHDLNERAGLFRTLIALDQFAAIELAEDRGWWDALDAVFENRTVDRDTAFYLAQVLGSRSPSFTNIFSSLVKAVPDHIAYLATTRTYSESLPTVWIMLRPQLDHMEKEVGTLFLRGLLESGVIIATEAATLYTRYFFEQPNEDQRFNYSHSFYQFLPSLLSRLSVLEAKRFFQEHVRPSAISDTAASMSTATTFGRHVLGAGPNLYECAKIITDRLSLPSAISWSRRILVHAKIVEMRKFEIPYLGKDISGPGHAQVGNSFSYQDNAWLLNIVLPLAKKWLTGLNLAQNRALFRELRGFSYRHQSFWARAMILATPSKRLRHLIPELIHMANLSGSIPSCSSAVAFRAKESLDVAKDYLTWAWDRNGSLSQPDESALLHRLIKSKRHSRFGRYFARSLVSSSPFANCEPHLLGFFAQLDWADQHPAFALELIRLALKHGYMPDAFDASTIAGLLKVIALDTRSRQLILAEPRLERFLASSIDFKELAPAKLVQLYQSADRYGKVEILQKLEQANELAILPVLQMALSDPDPTPDSDVERQFTGSTSSISGVRVNAYWTYLQLLQKRGLTFYRTAGFDVLDFIAGERGPYAAHHGLMVIHVLLNCAANEKDYDLGLASITVAAKFLGVHNPTIDEQIASFIIWWWVKLPKSFHDLAESRLHYTESYFGRLLSRATIVQDTACLEKLVSAIPGAPEPLLSWSSWYLWRLMSQDSEHEVTLNQTEVQIIIRALISKPSSDRYGNIARLLIENQAEDQSFTSSAIISMIKSAVLSDIQFFMPLDFDVSAETNADDVLELINIFSGRGAAVARNQLFSISLKLLESIENPEQAKRVMEAFQSLEDSPLVTKARESWRRKMGH